MRRRYAQLIGLTLGLALPMVVFADGLVPCGTGDTPCTLADFFKLALVIFNFITGPQGILLPLATLSFAIGGIYYVSGAYNEKNIDTAKGIFKSTLIGIVLALGSYTLVHAFLYFFVDPKFISTLLQ